MDKQEIKFAAAYLADNVQEVREKEAAGDTLKSTLTGAGLGTALGGLGGGLLSWLRNGGNEKRRRRIIHDALAGALVGGGLGASAGALPGLLESARETVQPKVAPDAKPSALDTLSSEAGRANVIEGLGKDVGRLARPTTLAAGVLGGSAGTAAGLALTRLKAMPELANLSEDAAGVLMRQVHPNMPADMKDIRGAIGKDLQRTGLLPTLTRSMEAASHSSPKGVKDVLELSKRVLGSNVKNYVKNNLLATRVLSARGKSSLKRVGLSGLAGAALAALGTALSEE